MKKNIWLNESWWLKNQFLASGSWRESAPNRYYRDTRPKFLLPQEWTGFKIYTIKILRKSSHFELRWALQCSGKSCHAKYSYWSCCNAALHYLVECGADFNVLIMSLHNSSPSNTLKIEVKLMKRSTGRSNDAQPLEIKLKFCDNWRCGLVVRRPDDTTFAF